MSGWRQRTFGSSRSSLRSPNTRDVTISETEDAKTDTKDPLAKTRESLPQLETKADDEIRKAGEILDRLISLPKSELKEMAAKLFQGVSHVLDYLGAIAKLHPIAEVVVNALKSVVGLQVQRNDNHASIAVVHSTMVQTVYHIRFLARIQTGVEEKLKVPLTTTFTHMTNTIKEFGGFVDAYHTCWQKTCQVLFAHHHKKKLADLRGRFEQYRKDLDELLNTMTQMRLVIVVDNTEEILRRLSFDDPDVEKAAKFVDDNGGPDKARTDPELLKTVATMLHEEVTLGMQATLRQGFDEYLEQHTTRYLKKLDSVQEAVTNAQAAILVRLDEGPHKLIEDKEVQEIWQENRWKSTVKCRIFVEGLHEYYQRQFNKYQTDSHVLHKDAWALEFLSRVMYHSAIGDAVDDDGSGYISVSEVNDFISEQQRLLRDWSKPQWFAFWACGWYNNNSWYYGRIKALVERAEQSIQSAGAHESLRLVQTAIGALKPLVLVADVEDPSATVDIPNQLRNLQEDYRRNEEEKMKDALDGLRYYLTDGASLYAAAGDSRIELHMMPLVYLLMVRLQDTVGRIAQCRRLEDRDHIALEELIVSCIAVFAAFEDRMNDLLRGWRFEGKDVNMQIERYADGLFRKCYREAHECEKAYDLLRKTMFGNGHALPRQLRPFGSKPRRKQSSAPEDMARDLAALTDRVRMLESRLPDPVQAM